MFLDVTTGEFKDRGRFRHDFYATLGQHIHRVWRSALCSQFNHRAVEESKPSTVMMVIGKNRTSKPAATAGAVNVNPRKRTNSEQTDPPCI